MYYEMTNVDLILNHRTLTFEAMIHSLLVIHLEQNILPHFYQASAVSQCIGEMMGALVVASEVIFRFE